MTSKEVQINGLILAGGKSTRMGFDKSLLKFSGKTQHERLYGLLTSFCSQTFFACNSSQLHLTKKYSTIIDNEDYTGPMEGITNAFKLKVCHWLVIPIDMPGITSEDLQKLISHSNESDAICFEQNGMLNPVFGLYTSKCAKYLNGTGYDSPKTFLNNLKVLTLPAEPKRHLNLNTKQEYQQFLDQGYADTQTSPS